jgi:hypothetical protein
VICPEKQAKEERVVGWAALGIALALLALLFFLAGCCPESRPEIRYVTQRVEVPVSVPCPAPPPADPPALAIEGLPPEAPPAEVLKAYAVTTEQLMGYSRQLEARLAAYRR